MRLSAFARMHVVQKEEKVTRLKEFIERDLVARKLVSGPGEKTVFRLVARSPESPVAVALASIAAEAGSLGIEIQAIFLSRAPAQSGKYKVIASLPSSAGIRYVLDCRLLDAHEQLVLGPRSAWIGDCMRRDPIKRDTYECYNESCEASALQACRAFEHLWSLAIRGGTGAMPCMRDGAAGMDQFDAPLLAGADPDLNPVALRH